MLMSVLRDLGYVRKCNFAIDAAAPWQKAPNYDEVREPGDITGISFKNIQAEAASIIDEPDSLWGAAEAWLRDFSFDNFTIAGQLIDNIDHFMHNEYVANMQFVNDPLIMAFIENAWSPGPGYSIDGEGWIDTEQWIGWLNVSQGHWLWSSGTESYFYLSSDEVRQSGAWLFSPRYQD